MADGGWQWQFGCSVHRYYQELLWTEFTCNGVRCNFKRFGAIFWLTWLYGSAVLEEPWPPHTFSSIIFCPLLHTHLMHIVLNVNNHFLSPPFLLFLPDFLLVPFICPFDCPSYSLTSAILILTFLLLLLSPVPNNLSYFLSSTHFFRLLVPILF
jgi:hypothetical protein